MKPYLSKTFFLISFIASGVVNLLATTILLAVRDADALIPILMISLAATIYSSVVGCVLWHKSWSAIQDGHARMTPGKAVGFLFIPFYNLYWIFQVLPGFAEDYNRYIERHQIKTPGLSKPFFMTAAILILVNIILSRIPVVGSIYSVVMLVMMIILVNQQVDAVNRLGISGEEATSVSAGETFLEHKTIGIIAIMFSVYAILQQLIFFLRLTHGMMAAGMLSGTLSLVYWGMVIYLGWLCRDKTLRIVAMCLPIVPILLNLWKSLRGGF